MADFSRSTGSLLSRDHLREALAHQRAHGKPLLRRLCAPALEEHTIVAWDSLDGTYTLAAATVIEGHCPRRLHLKCVRARLSDGEATEGLERALGDAYVEALLDAAVRQGATDDLLDERSYAQAYHGPFKAGAEAITHWLNEDIDLYELERGREEEVVAFLEHQSPAAIALSQFISRVAPQVWFDPESGSPFGGVTQSSDGPGYDVITVVDGAAALTCLQWTADLLDAKLRFEVRGG